MTDTAPCDDCGESIDPSLLTCPHCGNEPQKAAKQSAYILIVIGAVLSVTVVGALVGVPMMLAGIAVLLAVHSGAANYSPTEHSFDAPF